MKNILKNVNVFKDLNILRVIKTTKKIYDFDKFNFNDLMTNIQNIEVELFKNSVDQMKNVNQIIRNFVKHAKEKTD